MDTQTPQINPASEIDIWNCHRRELLVSNASDDKTQTVTIRRAGLAALARLDAADATDDHAAFIQECLDNPELRNLAPAQFSAWLETLCGESQMDLLERCEEVNAPLLGRLRQRQAKKRKAQMDQARSMGVDMEGLIAKALADLQEPAGRKARDGSDQGGSADCLRPYPVATQH